MTMEPGKLTKRRGHLSRNRRSIIGRSFATALASSVPIPVFEEWLSSRIHRGTIRRIAASHAVDLDEAAVRAIADGPAQPPEWTDLASSTIAFRLLSRSWRTFVLLYLATRRARAVTHTFAMATLFDHYCARMHVGLGLDGRAGYELRALMSQAVKRTPGGLSRHLVRRGVLATARAAVRAPGELADIASGGMIRRLLARRAGEVEAVEEIDLAIERELRSKKGFLARATAVMELHLAAEGNPYLDSLLERFESLWQFEHEPAGGSR